MSWSKVRRGACAGLLGAVGCGAPSATSRSEEGALPGGADAVATGGAEASASGGAGAAVVTSAGAWASGGGGAVATGGAGGGGDAPVPCRAEGDGVTTLVFANDCPQSVTVAGSDIESRQVPSGEHRCVSIGSATEPLSSKRYWGWVGVDPGAERHTLAEFTFNTDFYDFDWYNISHVDAHNLPMQIKPLERPDCVTLTCAESWLESCPDVGRFRDASGAVVACVSPERDNPESPVAQYFESCDDAYAWSGDDQQGDDPSPMRACAGEDWEIRFCPTEGA